MSAPLLVALAVSLATNLPPSSPVHLDSPGGPRPLARFELPAPTPRDGVRQPEAPRAVDYSDWYYRRLTLHRWASWTILPLFAAQYLAGTELAKGEERAADWAEDAHPALALGVGALFGVNTITGVWNLWDARHDPEGRGRRTTHAVLMLLADAGFVATAILADEAEDDGSGVGAHRTMAIASMAAATVSWAIMLDLFR